jgi:hypothetical protein
MTCHPSSGSSSSSTESLMSHCEPTEFKLYIIQGEPPCQEA